MNTSTCDAAIVRKGDSDQADINLIQQLQIMSATIRRWQVTAKQRRELKVLTEDPDFLKDIGVSAGDAMVEARKPFWKE